MVLRPKEFLTGGLMGLGLSIRESAVVLRLDSVS